MDRIKRAVLPVYPFLFGLYPVLYLWSANRAQQPAYVVVPSLLVSLAVLAGIFLLALAVLRNAHRAALLATVLNLYFLSYGHIYNLIEESQIPISQELLLLASALLVVLLLVYLGVRRIGSPDLTKALNLISAALVIMQLVIAAPYYLSLAQQPRNATGGSSYSEQPLLPWTGAADPPDEAPLPPKSRDVYFILIDNYGREDVLLQKAKFDNSELTDALKERGFLFPDCAQSNYFATAPVMTSILNMDYLRPLGIKEASYIKRGGYADMAPLMQNNLVLRKFKEYGYKTVTFRGFMGMIDIKNSDVYVNYEENLSYAQRQETMNFEDLYYKTTILYPLVEEFNLPELIAENAPDFIADLLPEESPLEPRFEQVYQQNLHAYDELERITTELEGPKFVYAHFYSAHWPFMLKPDGSLRLPFTQKITNEGYIDAVKYTNTRVLEIVDYILANSEIEPVIILQGDHSNGWEGKVEWSGKDRLKILSAYYLPDGGDKLLYDEISPVNNFRLVFRHYFNEPIELLPDVHYYLDMTTKHERLAPLSCMSKP